MTNIVTVTDVEIIRHKAKAATSTSLACVFRYMSRPVARWSKHTMPRPRLSSCKLLHLLLLLGSTSLWSVKSVGLCDVSLSYTMTVIRSPVLWTVDLMFCACFFFYFFSHITFSDVCKPIFSKLFHMTWLYSKKRAVMRISWKCPLTKIRSETPQISPNLASNRNILCAVTRNVEGK